MSAQPEKSEAVKVFISGRNSICGECNEELGRQAWITLTEEKGALCLTCADLDHLEFLASGDAALTRRARKYSALAAVVLKFSRARQRYERQGLLVEVAAINQAEAECFGDKEVRERRRIRAAILREDQDQQYLAQFAARVRELFPHCPPVREQVIAGHACIKYSGRVGRSASAKAFDEATVRLAVVAHIRHSETTYDSLLARGFDRRHARADVNDAIDRALEKWETAPDRAKTRAK